MAIVAATTREHLLKNSEEFQMPQNAFRDHENELHRLEVWRSPLISFRSLPWLLLVLCSRHCIIVQRLY